MSQWKPEPPQGSTTEQGLVIIGRPPIPKFSPPQGIAVGIAPPLILDPFLAIYPNSGDLNFNKKIFIQVNKGEFLTPQTDFIWEITSSVGPGVFQQASGFDIRPFLNNERDIANAIDNNNNFVPGFTLQAIQLSDDQLHLFAWEFGGAIEEWVLSAPHVFPPDGTPSDFQFTDPEGNGRDIKFMDNGTKMATCGSDDNTIRLYSLPTPNSLSTPPVLLDTFAVSFLGIEPQSCDFSVDGMQLYVIDRITDDLSQWDLTTPFTLPAPSTSPDRVFPFNPPVIASLGNSRMFIDGTAFYLMSSSPNREINKYINTDGPNQIPTVNKSPDAVFDVSAFDTNPRAISVSLDGSLIWFSGRLNDTLFELFIPGQLLEYEVTSVNVTTGDFTIKIKVPTIEDLTFVQLAVGFATATDGSTVLGAGTALSTFETPLFTQGEDNFLVDDQDRNLAAEQS